MNALLPRIEISLSQIQHNARTVSEHFAKKGIFLMGVSKPVLGDPSVAEAMIRGGVKFIADSRIENIQRMKNAGLSTQFVLLRTALSQAESVIAHVDISFNTEFDTLKELSYYANLHNKKHKVIIMVELGDLREGVLPEDIALLFKQVLQLPCINIVGIGCNLACYGGVKPSHKKMEELSELAEALENKFQINLEVISGGNSANFEWYDSVESVGRINNLRLGESIFLGCETLQRNAIPGLYTHAFNLIAEVIEAKDKPSLPYGDIGQDAFGNIPVFEDRGVHRRVILALGRQDVLTTDIALNNNSTILGSSSDHIILENRECDLAVGDEVSFNLDYGGLLSVMTSPFVQKQYIT
jgi:ornithine racemase